MKSSLSSLCRRINKFAICAKIIVQKMCFLLQSWLFVQFLPISSKGTSSQMRHIYNSFEISFNILITCKEHPSVLSLPDSYFCHLSAALAAQQTNHFLLSVITFNIIRELPTHTRATHMLQDLSLPHHTSAPVLCHLHQRNTSLSAVSYGTFLYLSVMQTVKYSVDQSCGVTVRIEPYLASCNSLMMVSIAVVSFASPLQK